jgi:hypothetical protein
MTLNAFAKSYMRDETLFLALSDYMQRGIKGSPEFLEQVSIYLCVCVFLCTCVCVCVCVFLCMHVCMYVK